MLALPPPHVPGDERTVYSVRNVSPATVARFNALPTSAGLHLEETGTEGIYELRKDQTDGEEPGGNPPVTPFIALLSLWASVYSGAHREGAPTTLGGLMATAGAVGSAAVMNQVVGEFSDTLAISTAVSLAGALAMGRWGTVSGVTLVATGAATTVAVVSMLDSPAPSSSPERYQDAIGASPWSPYARAHHYEAQFQRATSVLDRMEIPGKAIAPVFSSGVEVLDTAVNYGIALASDNAHALAVRLTTAVQLGRVDKYMAADRDEPRYLPGTDFMALSRPPTTVIENLLYLIFNPYLGADHMDVVGHAFKQAWSRYDNALYRPYMMKIANTAADMMVCKLLSSDDVVLELRKGQFTNFLVNLRVDQIKYAKVLENPRMCAVTALYDASSFGVSQPSTRVITGMMVAGFYTTAAASVLLSRAGMARNAASYVLMSGWLPTINGVSLDVYIKEKIMLGAAAAIDVFRSMLNPTGIATVVSMSTAVWLGYPHVLRLRDICAAAAALVPTSITTALRVVQVDDTRNAAGLVMVVIVIEFMLTDVGISRLTAYGARRVRAQLERARARIGDVANQLDDRAKAASTELRLSARGLVVRPFNIGSHTFYYLAHQSGVPASGVDAQGRPVWFIQQDGTGVEWRYANGVYIRRDMYGGEWTGETKFVGGRSARLDDRGRIFINQPGAPRYIDGNGKLVDEVVMSLPAPRPPRAAAAAVGDLFSGTLPLFDVPEPAAGTIIYKPDADDNMREFNTATGKFV